MFEPKTEYYGFVTEPFDSDNSDDSDNRVGDFRADSIESLL